jgi:tetratricopeptide (TPR) repeat protein
VQRETGRPPGGGPGSPPSEGRGREGSSGRPPFGGGFFPSREENRQHITTAIQLLEALPNADRDTRAQLLLAQCYRELSNQRDWDDPDARKADWEKAVAILQELVREAPKTPEFRFELTEVYADVDPRRLPEDRLGEAEPRLREALRLSQDLVTEAPDVPAYAAGQTQILVRLGHLLRRTNRNDEALSRYQEAIAIQTGLAARFPETPDHLVWSARVRRYSAEILQTEERYDEAIALLKQSAADVEPFVTSSSARDNPAMFFASFTLSETYGTLADILRDQGLTDEADVCRQRAREFGPQKLFRNRRPPPDSTDRN